MSANSERPQGYIIERAQTQAHSPRVIGGSAVARTTAMPGSREKSQAELLNDLNDGVRGVVGRCLVTERRAEDGRQLTTTVVNRAFLTQQRRLEREDITDEMSTTDLMRETLAQAVLYAPTVSEAIARNQKKKLSRFNDLMTQAAIAIPRKYMNMLIPVVRGESNRLNRNLGVPSEIGGKGVLEQVMRGIRPEVCVGRAANSEGGLHCVAGTIEQDGRGIDLSLTRFADGARVHLDIKNKGAFRSTVEEWFGIDTAQSRLAMESGYIRTGYDREDGVAKYLFNAGHVAEIPDQGLEFSPKGEANTQLLLNQILDLEVK